MNEKHNGPGILVDHHAPEHLRDAFQDYVFWGIESEQVKVDGEAKPREWLFGQLEKCTDILPGIACEEIDIKRGSTYAQAVKSLREHFKCVARKNAIMSERAEHGAEWYDKWYKLPPSKRQG